MVNNPSVHCDIAGKKNQPGLADVSLGFIADCVNVTAEVLCHAGPIPAVVHGVQLFSRQLLSGHAVLW